MRYSARAWRSKLADPAGRRDTLDSPNRPLRRHLQDWADHIHVGTVLLITTRSHATVGTWSAQRKDRPFGNTHVGCDAGSKYDLYFLMTVLILSYYIPAVVNEVVIPT